MIDLDLFKHINDSYGHPVGDEVLVTFVKQLQQHIRKTDFLARIGGEEFVIIMPETEIDEAIITADKLKVLVSKNLMIVITSYSIHYTKLYEAIFLIV